MKILITGGAGYIGSVMVPELLNKGYNVIVVDNFMYKQQSLMDCCHDKRLEIIRGDVRDYRLISKLIKSLEHEDFILPLAAYVGPICDRFPLEATSVNLDAIKMLLEIIDETEQYVNIIYACTNSGYGLGEKNTEGKSLYCTEETPLRPISLYGRLKVDAEKLILESGNSISLRLATVMGCSPSMRLDLLVNDLVYRATTDRFVGLYEPNAKRNYINIRDVCKAFIYCINNWSYMKDEIYNVGLSSANLSKYELCQEIKKIIPEFDFVEIKGSDPDKRDYMVSNDKLEKTGWEPDYSLQDTIRELIKGYRIVRKGQYGNI